MCRLSTVLFSVALIPLQIQAQEYGEPERGEPGDVMIQTYLANVAAQLHGSFAEDLKSIDEWEARRRAYREQYLTMLGLAPLPERTPLQATITGTFADKGFVVEMLHYQSRPGLYATANLYRPAQVAVGERLPAVLYACGHSGRGRNGNKTAFQSHGMWFARHGYVCLVVDTLQLGEVAAIHHGTYREERWWWHSRGYTPAGVECWNGVRGIDYLVSRADVDPERIAVTGISGGGAATFWVAAADERVAVAVPVSGMADLPSYVSNRVINGHCDCMFLHNAYEWPWTRIAGLIAPRPLLFVNSDHDGIFPMDANERIISQLERLYTLHGAGDQVDAVVSVGGHDYRQDIRQAVYRFTNMHLKGDARPVTDSEVDLVQETRGQPPVHPIDPERLRVFPTDADIPADELNTTIDQHFVPLAEVAVPSAEEFAAWQASLRDKLRDMVFRSFPEQVAPAWILAHDSETEMQVETESGIALPLERIAVPANGEAPKRVLLVVQLDVEDREQRWVDGYRDPGDVIYRVRPRGIGETRWTRKNPPNYVERAHVLLGRTVDTGRVLDVVAVARRLGKMHSEVPVHLAGHGAAAILAAYAALWAPEIAGIDAHEPLVTHSDSAAPQFLNVLRVGDVPDLLGLLAPRPLVIESSNPRFDKIGELYEAAGATAQLVRRQP
jgi:dienelactone hydrolase